MLSQIELCGRMKLQLNAVAGSRNINKCGSEIMAYRVEITLHINVLICNGLISLG